MTRPGIVPTGPLQLAQRLVAKLLARSDPWWIGGLPLTDEDANRVEPAWVLSTGRCGTAWLTALLDRSEQVAANHHLPPQLVRQSRLAHADWRRFGLDGSDKIPPYWAAGRWTELVRGSRDDLISAAQARGRRYVETNNRITFLGPAILAAYPRSRFIPIVRHPADFVRSGVARGWYRGHGHDVGRPDPVAGAWDEPGRSPETWSQLEKVAWLWNETQAFIATFAGLAEEAGAPVPTFTSEAMFSEPETALAIARYCGAVDLAQDDAVRLQGRRINPQRGDRMPPYAQWSAADRQALRERCPLAASFGYEL